jgi:uncharacterized membrane protein YphA (DoxX/SURF4 family)
MGLCVPSSVIFHHQFGDPGETPGFFRDVAIAGSLLLITVHGAGSLSLDNRLATRPI